MQERRGFVATSNDFVEYVCGVIAETGSVTCRKMFGEYMVYVNRKPLLLVCDNTVFVRILPETERLLADAERGFPYEGAKEHFILDIDDAPLACETVRALEPVVPIPKPKKRKPIK